MRPHIQAGLLDLKREFYGQLTLRVSIDHFDATQHEEGGRDTWAPMINGLKWLHQNQFTFHLAGSTRWGEDERTLQEAYQQKLTGFGINFDVDGPVALISFRKLTRSKRCRKSQYPAGISSVWNLRT